MQFAITDSCLPSCRRPILPALLPIHGMNFIPITFKINSAGGGQRRRWLVWLRNISIGGCLVAAVLFVAGLLNAEENSNQGIPTEAVQQQAVTPPPPAVTDSKESINWNEPKCGAAQSHDEADLCEQRKMAKAAEDRCGGLGPV